MERGGLSAIGILGNQQCPNRSFFPPSMPTFPVRGKERKACSLTQSYHVLRGMPSQDHMKCNLYISDMQGGKAVKSNK
jgi:hypothetical protein